MSHNYLNKDGKVNKIIPKVLNKFLICKIIFKPNIVLRILIEFFTNFITDS